MALDWLQLSKAAKKAHAADIKKTSSYLKTIRKKRGARREKPENLAKKSMEVSQSMPMKVSGNQEQAWTHNKDLKASDKIQQVKVSCMVLSSPGYPHATCHAPRLLQLSATLKMLEAVRAPRVLLQLVCMVYWMNGAIPQDVDFVEYFAGCMQVTWRARLFVLYAHGMPKHTCLPAGLFLFGSERSISFGQLG